jgi:hypothetical protein
MLDAATLNLKVLGLATPMENGYNLIGLMQLVIQKFVVGQFIARRNTKQRVRRRTGN